MQVAIEVEPVGRRRLTERVQRAGVLHPACHRARFRRDGLYDSPRKKAMEGIAVRESSGGGLQPLDPAKVRRFADTSADIAPNTNEEPPPGFSDEVSRGWWPRLSPETVP